MEFCHSFNVQEWKAAPLQCELIPETVILGYRSSLIAQKYSLISRLKKEI